MVEQRNGSDNNDLRYLWPPQLGNELNGPWFPARSILDKLR